MARERGVRRGRAPGVVACALVAALLASCGPGAAPPGHGSALDAHALPRVISELRARGYSFVTLNALAG
jgi:hypothetical protein